MRLQCQWLVIFKLHAARAPQNDLLFVFPERVEVAIADFKS